MKELRASDYVGIRKQDGKRRMTKIVRDAKIEIAKIQKNQVLTLIS